MYGLTRKSFNELFDTFDAAVKRFYRLPKKDDIFLQVYVNQVVWKTYPITCKGGRYYLQDLALSEIFPEMSLLETCTSKIYTEKPVKPKIHRELLKETPVIQNEPEPETDPQDLEHERYSKHGPLMELKRLFYQVFQKSYPEDMPLNVRMQFDILELMETRSELAEHHDNIEQEQLIFDSYNDAIATIEDDSHEWDELFE